MPKSLFFPVKHFEEDGGFLTYNNMNLAQGHTFQPCM
jgi:hypothetical protein